MDKVTFEEAAEMLSVTRQTIYNYIEKKLLTPHKAFNGRVYFSKKEVAELQPLPFSEE
jgi:excisionase family DNA binding protein